MGALAFVIGCSSAEVGHPQQATRPSESRLLQNSEQIRLQFGSYGIEVLDEGDAFRVSNLFSLAGTKKVTRTIAVVNYSAHIPADALSPHLEIKRGGSIGEVFVRNGWDIAKQNLYFGELKQSADLSGVYARMGGITPHALATHVYEFVVSRKGEKFRYATITEIHHPVYLSEARLEEIYGGVPNGEDNQKEQINSILETAKEAILDAVPPLRKAALLFPTHPGAGNFFSTPLPSV